MGLETQQSSMVQQTHWASITFVRLKKNMPQEIVITNWKHTTLTFKGIFDIFDKKMRVCFNIPELADTTTQLSMSAVSVVIVVKWAVVDHSRDVGMAVLEVKLG